MIVDLDRDSWEVRPVSIAFARGMVEREHYARGASNTATCLFGLYWKYGGDAVGISWWIPPTKSAALATFPQNWQGVLALSRLVILPNVPRNAASFLLSKSRGLIDPARWPVLVTYADTWRGHTGGIYKADNWQSVGLTTPEAVYIKAGRMVTRKRGPTTLTHAQMLADGAEFMGRHAKHKFVFDRSKLGDRDPMSYCIVDEAVIT